MRPLSIVKMNKEYRVFHFGTFIGTITEKGASTFRPRVQTKQGLKLGPEFKILSSAQGWILREIRKYDSDYREEDLPRKVRRSKSKVRKRVPRQSSNEPNKT